MNRVAKNGMARPLPFRVLAIDDSPEIIDTIRAALGSEFLLLASVSAAKGLKLAAQHRPDLILLDVVMPELDGPSLLRELRKTRPELKIIFVSGYAEEAFRKNLPEGESFRFLPKPFSLKELAIAVKETLGR